MIPADDADDADDADYADYADYDVAILAQIQDLAARLSDQRTRGLLQSALNEIALNPQPLPPVADEVADPLNPQPLPPVADDVADPLNPQPLPPIAEDK